MPDARIRPARPADLDQARQLYLAMMREMAACGDDGLADEAASDFLHRRLELATGDTARLLLVAEEGERPGLFGMLEASVTGLDDVYAPKRLLHVHALFVTPSERRRGVGRALLEAALVWGRQQRCAEADLSVLERNPACRLYEQVGFLTFRRQMRLRL